jgi:hypothetical protein
MKTASDNSPQLRPAALARSAGSTGRAGRELHVGLTPHADRSAVKLPEPDHGRADARPSRSAAGAGNEGTGHAPRVEQRMFSHVAVQV